MAALMSMLLFVIMQCVFTIGAKSSLGMQYTPTGPRLCRELCQESGSSVPLIREFRCRRKSAKDSFICLKQEEDMKNYSLTETNCLGSKKELIKEGKSITDLKTNPDKILYEACEKGSLCTVQYIVSHGLADINCKGSLGRTPVMAAVLSRQLAVFDFLVSQGCDLSVKDDHNDTVLHLACKVGDTDIVRKLVVDRKYDPSIKGKYGWTPLTCSVFCGHTKVFDLLVSTGSDPRKVRFGKKNILHTACLGGHVDMIKHIVSLQIFNLESTGDHGKTPLLYAVRNSFVEAVEFLVNKGCNLRVVDSRGINVLHAACLGGNVNVVKYVIKQDVAGMESRGFNGWTPLMMAATKGRDKVFDFLLNEGCRLMAVDNFGGTVLHVASESGSVQIVKQILSRRKVMMEVKDFGGKTPVMTAANLGRLKVVELFVRKGCILKTTDHKGNNVLHAACISGHLDVVKYLLKLHSVGKKEENKNGHTPLQVAKIMGHKRIVAFLKTKLETGDFHFRI